MVQRNNYGSKIFWQKVTWPVLLIIFSETASLIDLKLSMEVGRGDLCQLCSNCGEICIVVFLSIFFSIFCQKIFFSETTSPIDLNVGMEVPRGDLCQICWNCGEMCIIVFLGQFFQFLVKKSSSLKPQVQLIWNLVWRFPGVTSVVFVQIVVKFA